MSDDIVHLIQEAQAVAASQVYRHSYVEEYGDGVGHDENCQACKANSARNKLVELSGEALEEILKLRANLHIPESCKTVQDLIDHLGEREAYTKIVADSIGYRSQIEDMQAEIDHLKNTIPLLVASGSLKERAEIAKAALGETSENLS